MPRFDAHDADCRIFTYKEGLLSAVAHDLELSVRSFEIEVAEDRSHVRASFDVRSIEVVDAVVGGRPSPGTLSARDKEKIRANVFADVIPVEKHPRIRFESTEVRADAEGWRVRGNLEVAGRSKDLVVRGHREDGAAVAEVVLHQPDYGIKPFSAMFGALKIKPDIRVRIRLPIS